MSTPGDAYPPPQRKKPSRWYLLLAFALAALLLFLAVRNVNFEESLRTLKNLRWQNFLLLFFLGSLAILTRAIRWGILLSAQKRIPIATMFWATSVGYLGNIYLPARAGEVLRSVLLGRKTSISVSYIFATALTERIMDSILLVIISAISLSTMQGLPDWLPSAVRIMAMLGLLAFLVLLFAPRLAPLFHRLLAWLPVPQRFRPTLASLLDNFLAGAAAFVHPGRAIGFLISTLFIWGVDAFNTIQTAQALQLQLTYPQAMLFLAALGLASAAPSTPGYLGIYQFVATTLLPVFGMNESQALTFVIILQGISICAITLCGLIGLQRLGSGKNLSIQV